MEHSLHIPELFGVYPDTVYQENAGIYGPKAIYPLHSIHMGRSYC